MKFINKKNEEKKFVNKKYVKKRLPLLYNRSVEEMSQQGGKNYVPFYPLIKGGKNGWCFKEMKNLFYYSQILEQGENISVKISIKQIPNSNSFSRILSQQ